MDDYNFHFFPPQIFICLCSDEDILADSDSDDELQEDILMDTEDKPQQRVIKKARSREQKFIHEDANTIVDLADTKAMSSIACEYQKQFSLSQESKSIILFSFYSI